MLNVFVLVMIGFTGCQSQTQAPGGSSGGGQKIAVISITSDAQQDPQAVNMGLTFANFCADEKYQVAIFFNVKGAQLPTKEFPDDFKYLEHDPLKAQIKALAAKGVEIHVCPVCMKDLEITDSEIMEEAFVTNKPKLFSKLGPDTMVFTY
jgi:predicted peroxiredoxin